MLENTINRSRMISPHEIPLDKIPDLEYKRTDPDRGA
jgi:hypothetical protein